MARRRSSQSQVRRDASVIASDELLDLSAPLRSGRELRSLEDRRTFHPSPFFRPAVRLDRGMRAFLTLPKTSPRVRVLPRVVKFENPQGVLICVRRHRRREVLFAKKRAGRGGMRKPRRNAFSNFSCRRK